MKTAAFFVLLLVICGAVPAADPTNAFRPGQVWLDNNNTPINAHGGGLLFFKSTWYCFGEHKVAGPDGNKAMVGVHCYSSADLYHWKDENIALAVSDDPHSDIAQGCILERPKVLYNDSTKKFVMWFHLERKGKGYKDARSGIAIADVPAGPYTFLHSLRPTPTSGRKMLPTISKRRSAPTNLPHWQISSCRAAPSPDKSFPSILYFAAISPPAKWPAI